MRWAHAQARSAARQGRPEAAAGHVAEALAIATQGAHAGLAPEIACLRGYVALHLSDAAAAVALEDADQQDPFILLLLAQAHERAGDRGAARACYERILASTSHALTAAIARPIARARSLAAE
jgi:hypothetical protein